MAILKIIPSTGFDQELRNGVLKEGSRQFINRFAIHGNTINQEIGNHIISIFEQTDVVRSLRSASPVDLPAHFGLSDTDSNSLVDGMVNIIRNSIQFSSQINNNTGVIRIRIIDTDWEKYTQLPGAKYISQSSKIEIPVIEWMLVNPNIDIGQAAYDIVFDGHGFDAQIQKVSRSGRAIMVSLESLGGSGGYVLPDIISKNSGLNFIELAIGQKGVADKIIEIVTNRIR